MVSKKRFGLEEFMVQEEHVLLQRMTLNWQEHGLEDLMDGENL